MLPTAPRFAVAGTDRFATTEFADIVLLPAYKLMLPVVKPFLTTKFFVVTVPYSLYI
jgi:hypothetical protein